MDTAPSTESGPGAGEHWSSSSVEDGDSDGGEDETDGQFEERFIHAVLHALGEELAADPYHPFLDGVTFVVPPARQPYVVASTAHQCAPEAWPHGTFCVDGEYQVPPWSTLTDPWVWFDSRVHGGCPLTAWLNAATTKVWPAVRMSVFFGDA